MAAPFQPARVGFVNAGRRRTLRRGQDAGCYGFAIHLPCWWRISARVSAQLAPMLRAERESAE
jgi:hypothetical protein